jgi:hypothetical protein
MSVICPTKLICAPVALMRLCLVSGSILPWSKAVRRIADSVLPSRWHALSTALNSPSITSKRILNPFVYNFDVAVFILSIAYGIDYSGSHSITM